MAFDFSYFARTDSGTANNPALNLTGAPAVEITFVNETATGGSGDYFLDRPADGSADPDTLVEINGTSYSFIYEFTGTMPTRISDGANQVPDRFEGSEVIVITVIDYPSPGDTTRLTFLPNEDVTAAEMNSFGLGAIDVQALDTAPPPSPICYAAGTRLLTDAGEREVETLRAGDRVITADRGAQPLLWTGRTELRWPGADPAMKPILIRAGALGGGRPARDLVVSPQHRILLSGDAVDRAGHGTEVLVPAKALLDLPGVRRMAGRRRVDYCHLLLARHEILQAEGAAAESFFPGPMALRLLSFAHRAQVLALLPALHDGEADGYGPTARPALSVRAAAEVCRAAGLARRGRRLAA